MAVRPKGIFTCSRKTKEAHAIIHGHGALSDWTWGCVALENEDISELYKVVAVGTPVRIKP